MLLIDKDYFTKSGTRRYKIVGGLDGHFIGKRVGESGEPFCIFNEMGETMMRDSSGHRNAAFDLAIPRDYVPWNQDTFPIGTWVKHKNNINSRACCYITDFTLQGVYFANRVFIGYEKLLDDFVTIDGQPCGKKVG